MGPMYNPYYHDLGLTKDTVALVRGSVGLGATLAGIALGGLCSVRLGLLPSLILGLGAGRLLHRVLRDPQPPFRPTPTFTAIMAADSFSQAFAGSGAGGLHVEPDEPGLHRHPIRPALVRLRHAGQVPEGLLRRGGGGPDGGPWPDGRLRHRLDRHGADGRAAGDPVLHPGPDTSPSHHTPQSLG